MFVVAPFLSARLRPRLLLVLLMQAVTTTQVVTTVTMAAESIKKSLLTFLLHPNRYPAGHQCKKENKDMDRIIIQNEIYEQRPSLRSTSSRMLLTTSIVRHASGPK